MSVARWPTRLLREMRDQPDPQADGLVLRILQEKGHVGAREFFKQLIGQVDLPLSDFPDFAQQWFAQHGQLPSWADHNLVLRGQQVFMDYGPMMLLLLFNKSLPTLYLVKRGAKVLELTGRLSNQKRDADGNLVGGPAENQRIFSRRIAETGQFLIDVMTPGSLAPGGTGILTAQRIRLVHSSIRQFIPEDKFDRAQMGQPINQMHLAITLMTFSVTMIDGLKQYGVDLKPEEEHAYFHAWSVVGHLIGINHNLIPKTVEEGRMLLNRILELEAAPSEAGARLTNALVIFTEEALKGKIMDNMTPLMIRYLIGEEYAEMLEVRPVGGCAMKFVPAFARKMFGGIEKLEEINEPIHKIADRVSERMVHHLVNYFNKTKGAQFRIPEQMRVKWEVEIN